MRRSLFIAASSVVLALVPFGAVTAASAPDDAFRGTWTSIDTDGSNQFLNIRGRGEGIHAMSLYDDSATNACDGSPAHLQGTGLVHGDSLLMRGTLTCIPGGNRLTGRISLRFVYDSGSDTLTDATGVIWHRS